MQKSIKKIVAVAMALALILSMTVVASADSTTIATWNNLITMRFGDPDINTYPLTHPEANMRFTQRQNGDFDVSYVPGVSNYYPDTLAFYISDGADEIDSFTMNNGVTVQPTQRISETEYQPTSNVQEGFYLLYIETATSGTKSFTINTENDGSVTLYFSVPTFEPCEDSLIHAYLPAPGQFTNEGITIGGWGDAYDSTGALKSNVATGVSLGYFGGYVIFDMGAITRTAGGAYDGGGVENRSDTPYGTDFIIYGNAFWNNSEPGCIQVSQDYTHWYDIAGSLYYTSDSVAASITYENPDPTEDYGFTTAQNNLGTRASVSYTGTNVTGSQVAYNTFHNHSWFPLNVNYFSGRYGNGELSHVDDGLPFASRTKDGNDITTYLTLTGQRVNTKATASLQFGYADVHQTKNVDGTTSYNPYATIASSSDWTLVVGNSSGGDPIDISWAVNPDGSPHYLDAVRYIRVYTGTTIDNPPFGEVSTEVCGIGVCTGTAVDSIPSPKLYVNSSNQTPANGNIKTVYNLGSNAVSITLSDYPSGSIIYMNGSTTNTSFTPSTSGTVVQVIIQSGDAAPYIGWLSLKSGW